MSTSRLHFCHQRHCVSGRVHGLLVAFVGFAEGVVVHVHTTHQIPGECVGAYSAKGLFEICEGLGVVVEGRVSVAVDPSELLQCGGVCGDQLQNVLVDGAGTVVVAVLLVQTRSEQQHVVDSQRWRRGVEQMHETAECVLVAELKRVDGSQTQVDVGGSAEAGCHGEQGQKGSLCVLVRA